MRFKRFASLDLLERTKDYYLIKNKIPYTSQKSNSETLLKFISPDTQEETIWCFRKKADFRYMWVFAAVKKSAIKFVQAETIKPLKKNYLPTMLDRDMVAKLEVGQTFNATDMDAAYWVIAYENGYISKRVFEHVMEKSLIDKTYKLIRNKALSCLVSPKKIETQEDGKVIHDSIRNEQLVKLYTDVRNKTYRVMTDIQRKLGRKLFIGYKIDCVFHHHDGMKLVQNYFDEHEYPYKTNRCTYLGDNRFIFHKDDGKSDVKKF